MGERDRRQSLSGSGEDGARCKTVCKFCLMVFQKGPNIFYPSDYFPSPPPLPPIPHNAPPPLSQSQMRRVSARRQASTRSYNPSFLSHSAAAPARKGVRNIGGAEGVPLSFPSHSNASSAPLSKKSSQQFMHKSAPHPLSSAPSLSTPRTSSSFPAVQASLPYSSVTTVDDCIVRALLAMRQQQRQGVSDRMALLPLVRRLEHTFAYDANWANKKELRVESSRLYHSLRSQKMKNERQLMVMDNRSPTSPSFSTSLLPLPTTTPSPCAPRILSVATLCVMQSTIQGVYIRHALQQRGRFYGDADSLSFATIETAVLCAVDASPLLQTILIDNQACVRALLDEVSSTCSLLQAQRRFHSRLVPCMWRV